MLITAQVNKILQAINLNKFLKPNKFNETFDYNITTFAKVKCNKKYRTVSLPLNSNYFFSNVIYLKKKIKE